MVPRTITVHFGVSNGGIPHVYKYDHFLCSNCVRDSYSFSIVESEFNSTKERLIREYNEQNNALS
ncbi:hypothetical protein [Ralstonia phage RP13]|nr:hypothetical protein [Ralstonia phage RP13]